MKIYWFTSLKLRAKVNQEGGLPRKSYRCEGPSLADLCFQFINCSVVSSAGSALGLEHLTKLRFQYGLGWLYQKVTGKVETGCSSRYDLVWASL